MSSLLISVRTKAKLLQKAKSKSNPDFKLKEAYEILAKTAGYSSWREWKKILEVHSLFSPQGAALWHVWYSNYDEALEHLKSNQALYLIPSQKHYFICDHHYLETLGVTLDNADLLQVGHNWASPRDPKAWDRLLSFIKKHSVL